MLLGELASLFGDGRFLSVLALLVLTPVLIHIAKVNAKKAEQERAERQRADAAHERAERRLRSEQRRWLRAQMDPALVGLLDQLGLFDRQTSKYNNDGAWFHHATNTWHDGEDIWQDPPSVTNPPCETIGEAFYRNGITTITILAGRNAGGGGGIQPSKLQKAYGIPEGTAIDLKQKAIALVPRPARSPARARPGAPAQAAPAQQP